MERLTNTAWRNFDPWECCGQDNFCTRGCHEKGGCNNGCIVPKLYGRLAAYEDTGLKPEEIKALQARALSGALESQQMAEYSGSALERADKLIEQYESLGPIDHLRDLLQAEKDGRLVVLDEKVVLSMCAGARAIENNKRLFGVTYGYDIFGVCGGPKEISYYDAAKKLREIAEPVLDREEAALAGEGGDD